MTRPELRPLTGVRALFAWAVVLFHLRLACAGWLPPGAVRVLGKGYLAVDMFFLLSGFVIWLNYGARLRNGGQAGDFLVRRFARVWPLHAAMLGAALALAAVLWASGRDNANFVPAAFPEHLLLVQDWGWSDALLWNDPSWSISAEALAYLLLPAAAALVPRGRMPTVVLAGAALLPLLLLHGLFRLAGADTLGADVSRFGAPRCLAEFACGAVLSVLWGRWRARAFAEPLAWLATAAAASAWALGLAETLAVPLTLAALLLALALGSERPRHPLGTRPIHWLGEVSYATYLSHFVLFIGWKLAVVRDAGDVPPASAAAYLLLVLLASAVLHHGLERPAQRTILRCWRARRRQPVAAPA